MTLKEFIINKALERHGSLSVDTIYREFYKRPRTKSLQVCVSRALKQLREEGLISRSNFKHAKVIELSKLAYNNIEPVLTDKEVTSVDDEETSETEETAEKETAEPGPKPNLYVFGAKTHYRDLNDPSRAKKATEFRIEVLADNVVDALRRAEDEIKKQSNDLEFSIMVLYGSAVTVYPPRK